MIARNSSGMLMLLSASSNAEVEGFFWMGLEDQGGWSELVRYDERRRTCAMSSSSMYSPPPPHP